MSEFSQQKIKDFRDTERTLIEKRAFKKAIDEVRSFVEKNISVQVLRSGVDDLERRYFYMLRLLGESSDFGDAQKAVEDIEKGLHEMVKAVEREYRISGDPSVYYARLRFARLRPEETVEDLIVDYIEELGRLAKDMTVVTDTRCRRRLEELSSDIFMSIWTLSTLDEEKTRLLDSVLTDKTIPNYDRVLWMHAVGLGDSFDEGRLKMLHNYAHSDDKNMAMAARIWLIVAGLRGNHAACAEYAHEQSKEVMSILVGYVRYVMGEKTDADNDIKDLHRLSAGIMGNMPMHDVDAMSDPERFMVNMPPEYIDKIKKFTEAQLRGDDVFASSLGKMRHYTFFNTFSNWFLPFHIGHSELAPVVDSEGVGMASILEKANNLCDGDKYALVLSMENTPGSVRNEISMRLYETISRLGRSGEGADIFELQDETEQMVASRMLKNLARIARHSPYADAAQLPTDVDAVNKLVQEICSVYTDEYETLADTLASVGLHALAAKMYKRYADYVVDDNRRKVRLLDKSAKAYTDAHMYDRAISSYRRAIEANDNQADYETASSLARLIIKCDKEEISDSEMANDMHYPASLLEPFGKSHANDTAYQKLMVEAYIYAEGWISALNSAYSLEYCLPEDGCSVKPTMVRIYLHLGDFHQATEAFNKISDKNRESDIEIEYAVACWYKGERQIAIALLQRMVEEKQIKLEFLSKTIKKALQEYDYGKDESALLIPDMLEYTVSGSRFGKL